MKNKILSKILKAGNKKTTKTIRKITGDEIQKIKEDEGPESYRAFIKVNASHEYHNVIGMKNTEVPRYRMADIVKFCLENNKPENIERALKLSGHTQKTINEAFAKNNITKFEKQWVKPIVDIKKKGKLDDDPPFDIDRFKVK